MPFRSRPDQTRDLLTQIESEVRARLEEAIDFVCLEALVQRRRARGLPEPLAQSTEDRAEFEAGSRTLLERLAREMLGPLDPAVRRRIDEAVTRGGADPRDRLVAGQVALARTLPDYWQRFEATGAGYVAEQLASGGERRGVLRRLLGR